MTQETGAYPDLVAALGALQEVPKAGKVAAGQRNYRFMTLPDLLTEVRRAFSEHNLALMQDVTIQDGLVVVTTIVVHTSGHEWRYGPLAIRAAADAQSIGSAISYGRRYSAAALVGLAGDDDDDGQAAQAARGAAPPTPPPVLRPMPPATPVPAPDATSPSAQRLATPDQIKRMWVERGRTQWDKDQIRDWVNRTLDLGTLDWHSKDLLGWQVSELIHRLQPPTFDPGPDRPRRGQ